MAVYVQQTLKHLPLYSGLQITVPSRVWVHILYYVQFIIFPNVLLWCASGSEGTTQIFWHSPWHSNKKKANTIPPSPAGLQQRSSQRCDLILNIYSVLIYSGLKIGRMNWPTGSGLTRADHRLEKTSKQSFKTVCKNKVISAHFDLKKESQSNGAEFSVASAFLGMAGKMDCIFWRNSFSCNRETIHIKPQLQTIMGNMTWRETRTLWTSMAFHMVMLRRPTPHQA